MKEYKKKQEIERARDGEGEEKKKREGVEGKRG